MVGTHDLGMPSVQGCRFAGDIGLGAGKYQG